MVVIGEACAVSGRCQSVARVPLGRQVRTYCSHLRQTESMDTLFAVHDDPAVCAPESDRID